MKNIVVIFVFIFCLGCSRNSIKLNNISIEFKDFPETKTLNFIPLSDSIMGEPSKILLYGDQLIMNLFSKNTEKHVVLFSLKDNKVIKEVIKRGPGPDEMLYCDIFIANGNLWLFDRGKQMLGMVSYDSLLTDSYAVNQYKLDDNSYYRFTMLNDSILLGTNNPVSNKKISYVNLKNGEKESKGEYAYLDESLPLAALVDASSCYIDINPKTKDILLSYRYTDMVEIFDSEGHIKRALHGPVGFDIDFMPRQTGMTKTSNTRKAFVTSYVTEDSIYLLYSGHTREEGWAYGSEIFVFSWDGKPLRKYVLPEQIYTFAVDEKNQLFYIYSLQTDQLVKANM